MPSDLTYDQWFGLQKEKALKAVFCKKKIYNNFWLSKDTTLILPASYFSPWDTSNELYFDLKRSFWIWPQVKVMIKLENVMLHISRSVWSSWTHLWCFHCSSWSLLKVIAKKLLVTFYDLKWPRRHDDESLVAIFRLRASSLPVTRCLRVFRMFFFQKRRLSFFSHWLIMERSQKWPDLGHGYKNFEINIL